MLRVHKLLTEEENRVLREIGEGTLKPFLWNNKFYNFTSTSYFTEFAAPLLPGDVSLELAFSDEPVPMVSVAFINTNEDGVEYEIAFTLNDTDEQAFKSTGKYYLRVMATVVTVIKRFIKVFDPDILTLRGADKRDVRVPGQKNRIYFAFMEKNAGSMGYRYTHSNNKLVLIKKR